MQTPIDKQAFEVAKQASRTSALVSAIGAIFIFIAFYYAFTQLKGLENQKNNLQQEIILQQEAINKQNLELGRLKEQLTSKTNELLVVTEAIQDYRTLSSKISEGIRYQFGRDYKSAIQCYDVVLEHIPDHPSVLSLKAQACYKLQRYKEGESISSKAIKLSPNEIDPYLTLAGCLEKQGRRKEAIDTFILGLSADIANYYQLNLATDFGEFKRIQAYSDEIYRAVLKIKTIQSSLKALGYYDGPIDGLVGPKCLNAIHKFNSQQDPIKRSTGVTNLLNSLQEALQKNTPQNYDSASTLDEQKKWILIQKHLQKLGYYSGKIDGILGPLTKHAIQRFKVNRGLTDDRTTVDSLIRIFETTR